MSRRRRGSSTDSGSTISIPRRSAHRAQRRRHQRLVWVQFENGRHGNRLSIAAQEVSFNGASQYDDGGNEGSDQDEGDIGTGNDFSFSASPGSTAPSMSPEPRVPSYFSSPAPSMSQASRLPSGSSQNSYSSHHSIGRPLRVHREPALCRFRDYYFNDYTEQPLLIEMREAVDLATIQWRRARSNSDRARRWMEALGTAESIDDCEGQAEITTRYQIRKQAAKKRLDAHLKRARKLQARQKCLLG